MNRLTILALLAGACLGAGMRGLYIIDSYISGCIEANSSMPHKDVRAFCELKLEAVRQPPKE